MDDVLRNVAIWSMQAVVVCALIVGSIYFNNKLQRARIDNRIDEKISTAMRRIQPKRSPIRSRLSWSDQLPNPRYSSAALIRRMSTALEEDYSLPPPPIVIDDCKSLNVASRTPIDRVPVNKV